MSVTRNVLLATRAKRAGASYSLRIVLEAKRAGIPVSLGFALIEKETGFRNVFGHDPTIFAGAGTVTRSKYREYKRRRPRGGMQGVGPAQLTWFEFQDEADELGGCWVPRHNIRVGFRVLADNIKREGRFGGIAAYNGVGTAAHAYAADVLDKAKRWHKVLVPGA